MSKAGIGSPRAQDEPSMEEILASIRRIISQEGGATEEDGVEKPEKQEHISDVPQNEVDASPEPPPVVAPPQVRQEIIREDKQEEIKRNVKEEIRENIQKDQVSLPEPEPEPEPDIPPSAGQENPDIGSYDMQEDDIILLTRMLNDDGTVIELSEQEGSRASDLISMRTARQSSEAFAALANALVRENVDKGRTLEDLIKDIMRPLLKDWLDNHLSDMVERIVQDEIEKIAGRTRH